MRCCKCGADWNIYKEALNNGGYEQARAMIEDCPMCERYFKTLLYPKRMTMDELLNLDTLPENKVRVV